jgi:hypothetical protein
LINSSSGIVVPGQTDVLQLVQAPKKVSRRANPVIKVCVNIVDDGLHFTAFTRDADASSKSFVDKIIVALPRISPPRVPTLLVLALQAVASAAIAEAAVETGLSQPCGECGTTETQWAPAAQNTGCTHGAQAVAVSAMQRWIAASVQQWPLCCDTKAMVVDTCALILLGAAPGFRATDCIEASHRYWHMVVRAQRRAKRARLPRSPASPCQRCRTHACPDLCMRPLSPSSVVVPPLLLLAEPSAAAHARFVDGTRGLEHVPDLLVRAEAYYSACPLPEKGDTLGASLARFRDPSEGYETDNPYHLFACLARRAQSWHCDSIYGRALYAAVNHDLGLLLRILCMERYLCAFFSEERYFSAFFSESAVYCDNSLRIEKIAADVICDKVLKPWMASLRQISYRIESNIYVLLHQVECLLYCHYENMHCVPHFSDMRAAGPIALHIERAA